MRLNSSLNDGSSIDINIYTASIFTSNRFSKLIDRGEPENVYMKTSMFWLFDAWVALQPLVTIAGSSWSMWRSLRPSEIPVRQFDDWILCKLMPQKLIVKLKTQHAENLRDKQVNPLEKVQNVRGEEFWTVHWTHLFISCGIFHKSSFHCWWREDVTLIHKIPFTQFQSRTIITNFNHIRSHSVLYRPSNSLYCWKIFHSYIYLSFSE